MKIKRALRTVGWLNLTLGVLCAGNLTLGFDIMFLIGAVWCIGFGLLLLMGKVIEI